ncbi:MAG: hypothetical protein RR891_09450 [Clostridium sp.]|uniref:hypothetical protein n=1 Tax=Clostridium sp. TaxID=1506 RepID=UPI00302BB48B
MIQVFCKEKGSGKTKALINLANSKVNDCKGNMVYIDDDTKVLLRVDKSIRFICSKDFKINNYKDLYGFLCGIISKDYDVENIFIDGVLSDICKDKQDISDVLNKLEYLSEKFKINFYTNISCEENNIPDTIKKYVV